MTEVPKEIVERFVDALIDAPDVAAKYVRDYPALLKSHWGPFGTSVLHFLVIEDFQSAVRHAHALGCDVNTQDQFGGTALTDAVRLENLEMVRLLFELGADPNIVTNIGTALDLAELTWSEEIVELVKSYGGIHEIEPDDDEDFSDLLDQ